MVKDISPWRNLFGSLQSDRCDTGLCSSAPATASTGENCGRVTAPRWGTVLVRDIRPGQDNAVPDRYVNVNGTLFFTADDGINGRELWKSDGGPPAARPW